MLRFPLAKLYDDPSQYPQAMAGRIEVRDKRKDEAGDAAPEDGAGHVSVQQGTERADAANALGQLKAPVFNRPKPKPAPGSNGNAQEIAATPAAVTQTTAPGSAAPAPASVTAPAAAVPTKRPTQAQAPQHIEPTLPPLDDVIRIGGNEDGFDIDGGWLDDDDDVRSVLPAPARPNMPVAASRPHPVSPKNAPTPNGKKAQAQAAAKPKVVSTSKAPAAAPTPASQRDTAPSTATPQQRPEAGFVRPLFGSAPETSARTQPTPVVLAPHLHELPHEAAARKVEPSEVAVAFMRWLQNGLASREIKHNETGAAMHFVEEGIALVSPLIFKLYARDTWPADQADATGL
ncbi:DNA-binding domain-containing protein [Acidovorax sp. SUPP3334]|uniref:conjugal transfer nickase/helicase domain-containing protein n=1 Tax=Acidovorax sp. SUPP3334 TaxID=2920881 RepID=UPI0023DE515B|nr:DNA-binding domain-containing protein [Acidovorax sp. SUPP3334]GKT26911.1 hypothetical protein AVHM3334_22385 [Acidovorax sp. SUPP3334]